MTYSEDSLRHFGILGMKWGVRRFQNPDGTLTEEGKKRYSSRDDLDRDFKNSMQRHSDAVERIRKNGPKITEMFNSISSDYDKHYKTFEPSDKQRKQMWNHLHEEFGVGPDDNELYQFVVEQHVNDLLMDPKSFHKSLSDKQKQMEKLQKEYWDDVHSISKEVMDKYGDQQIVGANNRLTSVYNIINTSGSHGESLLSKNLDTSFNAYIMRHFEDYWFGNDEYWNAMERLSKEFSVDEYNRRYGK